MRQHRVRCDIATGKREIDHPPELRGEKKDGFPTGRVHFFRIRAQ